MKASGVEGGWGVKEVCVCVSLYKVYTYIPKQVDINIYIERERAYSRPGTLNPQDLPANTPETLGPSPSSTRLGILQCILPRYGAQQPLALAV